VLKKTLVIIAFLSFFVAISGISPVFASSQLEVTIDPNSDTAIAKMTYQRSINIDYSDGGNLAETMNGLNKEISDLEWDNFVYLRKSLRGKHLELWHHISGCRQWFKVQRDTATHEIFKTLKPNEDI